MEFSSSDEDAKVEIKQSALDALQAENRRTNNILIHLENRLAAIEESTTKMDSHVDFVESIYNKIKWPFWKLMSMVISSPEIEQEMLTIES